MRYAKVLVGVLCATGALLPTSAFAQDDTGTPRTQPVNYADVIHIGPFGGVKGDLAPIVRIVSPLADSRVAAGEGRVGAGSPNGTGFAVTLEIVTRDKTTVSLREATNIRRVDLLNAGALNPNAPGLYFFFDVGLITPDGSVLPKFNNFASAFNIAGTDDTPGDGVTAWLGWHVLESVPEDVNEFTMTAAFVDDAGRIGIDRITLKVDRSRSSGQALTPEPLALNGVEGLPDAPEVTLIAPRVPTSIASAHGRCTAVAPIRLREGTAPHWNSTLFQVCVVRSDRSRS